jgi:hypothetical protein
MVSLIKLTENDKRLIIVLLLVVILLFVIAGYVGLLVRKIMNAQASKADDMLHDVVEAGVITNERKLLTFGIRKNWREFFKRVWIPFLIMLSVSTIFLFYCIFSKNWSYNIWDYKKQGFNTLFYVHDWSSFYQANTEGFSITWPKLISSPHLSGEAWVSYIFVPGMIVGGTWFMFEVQGYIARAFRIYKLSKKAFRKTMDNVTPSSSPIKPE